MKKKQKKDRDQGSGISDQNSTGSTEQTPGTPSIPTTPTETATPTELALAAEIVKWKDIAMRGAADMENFRKRAQREREDSVRYANTSLVERLLPTLDSFEMGLDAARTATNAEAVVQGFEMVKKQLDDFLRDQGVEVIDATEALFDPNLHDAMAMEASDTVPEGHVIRQMRKGYKLRDRLVRPASVFVSQGKK